MIDSPTCVVGLGPIGALVCAHLQAAGEPVFGVDSSGDRAARIRDGGFEVEGLARLSCRMDAVGSLDEAAARGPFHTVIVATKANDLLTLASRVPALCGESTTIAGFQNGVGTEDLLVAHLGPSRVVRAVVNFAGQWDAPERLRMTFFHGPNWLGGRDREATLRARSLATRLTRAGLHTEAVDDVTPHVWRKTIHLSILAPLCAITRLDMRSALADRGIRHLAQGLLSECIAVAHALGVEVNDDFFESSMKYVLDAGNHPPSMLVDINRGRPTEVAFINGKVVEAGERLGLPVPLNRTVAALVAGIESATRIGAPGAPAMSPRIADLLPTVES